MKTTIKHTCAHNDENDIVLILDYSCESDQIYELKSPNDPTEKLNDANFEKPLSEICKGDIGQTIIQDHYKVANGRALCPEGYKLMSTIPEKKFIETL